MKSNKHDHKATKKIKAWIFAIMLLLPFLFIVPTAFYYGFNEQAQAQERLENNTLNVNFNQILDLHNLSVNVGNISYEDEYFVINNDGFVDIDISVPYELEINDKLLIDYNFVNNNQAIITLNLNNDDFDNPMTIFNSDDSIIEGQLILDVSQDLIIEDTSVYWLSITSSLQLHQKILFNRLNVFNLTDMFTDIPSVDEFYSYFPLTNYSYNSGQEITIITDTTSGYTMSITDSMSTAWTNTWSNPLFSWTNNSPFYTAMSNFTNVFGIDNMQMANLLTYIATITAIYIVFDIVIELFTYVTHLIPRSE